jgi:cytochrome c oxidase subunit II
VHPPPSGSDLPPCRARLSGWQTTALLLVTSLVSACAQSPSYLRTFGTRADREASLGWVLLITASGVVVVVSVLLVLALVHRRPEGPAIINSGDGLRWILVGGIAVPAVILVVMFFLAMSSLNADRAPAGRPALTIQIVGHRWWWEIRYPGGSPAELFVTANELHIPTGRPIRLELATADVIHSFWIPQLAGKTDLIPGQRNVSWIEADSTGSYWGHCAEYCGLQHTNMMLSVIAERPDQFTRWLEQQRRPAESPLQHQAAAGRGVFLQSACALCHTIRGTTAGGAVGPDLTHLATRHTIAAGTLPNNPGNLAGWVANPQGIKPGVLMPAVPLLPRDLHALLSYLQSLH